MWFEQHLHLIHEYFEVKESETTTKPVAEEKTVVNIFHSRS